MVKYGKEIAVISLWLAVILTFYPILDIEWFQPGDFAWRASMAYHAVLVPVWMMLVLAYARHLRDSFSFGKLFGTAALSASILTGIGSALIRTPGLSVGVMIQVAGMILAEITALVIIIQAMRQHFSISENSVNTTAWWTVSVGLLGMSLATPLGHIAGAAKDLGQHFSLFGNYVAMLGLKPDAVIDGFVGSHSHQVVAAFLAAGFALPFMRKSPGKSQLLNSLATAGLFIISIATIMQVALYEYCAWFSWEPPDLFVNGANGLPLDDFILVILGFGLLLLLPAFLAKNKTTSNGEDYSRFTGGLLALLLVAYLISVVVLGLRIEFHEQFFGHGEGNAPGVANDLAYIRSHLLFGFMIIPVLLSILLNLSLSKSRSLDLFLGLLVTFAVATGLAGALLWTFALNVFWLELSYIFTIIVLLVFAAGYLGPAYLERSER